MDAVAQNPKLLEPIATVASVVLRLLMALIVAACVLSAVHGWGRHSICVTDWTSDSSYAARDFVPEPGARVASVPRYCTENATTSQNTLAVLGPLVSLAVNVGSLFLLNVLLRGASRDGVHTLRTAGRLRLLGWWLLIGSVVAATAAAVFRTAILASLAQDVDLTALSWLQAWHAPYLAILVGLGLLTFSRITRAGARMREDLEGLI
ncbi:amino acid transporter [Streptomyces sp. B3I7]|uniref:DUF2975 domain-containing protein n=1 Tax=Streptomyces sp. B3I7 TaxID=3042269 RepID=UPI00277E17F8|nr:DUF2975 domain-containing protein [Streptomyces sp. B3I7]MDQ0813407.1 amino acid transporter [Streptomyces sp. B3I7]